MEVLHLLRLPGVPHVVRTQRGGGGEGGAGAGNEGELVKVWMYQCGEKKTEKKRIKNRGRDERLLFVVV